MIHDTTYKVFIIKLINSLYINLYILKFTITCQCIYMVNILLCIHIKSV